MEWTHAEAVKLNDFQPVNMAVSETIEMSNLNPPNINTIFPAELLETIFAKLSPQDLKSAVTVCRLWRKVGEVPRFWTWVSLTVTTDNMESMREALTSRRLRGARVLTQQQHVELKYSMKQSLSWRCYNLHFKTLTIKKQLNSPLSWFQWLFSNEPEVLVTISVKSNHLNIDAVEVTIRSEKYVRQLSDHFLVVAFRPAGSLTSCPILIIFEQA